GVPAQHPVGRDRGLDQRMGARRDARRTVADRLALEPQWWRAGSATPVFVVERAVECRADGDVELSERLGVFAPQVQVKPRALQRDGRDLSRVLGRTPT